MSDRTRRPARPRCAGSSGVTCSPAPRGPSRSLSSATCTSSDPHSRYLPGRRDRVFADEHPGTLRRRSTILIPLSTPDWGRIRDDVAHLRALYDGEVQAADRQFGRFVEQLKFFDLYDESLIILVGDHGEEFGEHGGFDHRRTLYEELLRVPLIVKFPRSWELSGRIATPVSTLDLAPTILEAAGGPGR